MKGNQLEAARKTVKVVRVLSYVLFFVVIGLFAAAIYIARGRRLRLLMAAGIGVLLVGLIVLVVRRYAGSYLVDALTTNDDDKDAVSASWAIGTQLLRNTGINAVIYGLGIMFAAWIAGASRPARWVRRVLAPTMRDHPIVIYGAVAVALFLVLITGPTDAQRILPLLVLFAFAFGGTELLRRQTEREFPPGRSASAA
jgi:drug/metabolite transporter (DMT)-like permease